VNVRERRIITSPCETPCKFHRREAELLLHLPQTQSHRVRRRIHQRGWQSNGNRNAFAISKSPPNRVDFFGMAGVEPTLGGSGQFRPLPNSAVFKDFLAPDFPADTVASRQFPTAPLDSVCDVKRLVSARWLLGMSVTSPTPDGRGQTGART
jgi:hypothetical protein